MTSSVIDGEFAPLSASAVGLVGEVGRIDRPLALFAY
jgi:hypothetical protein